MRNKRGNIILTALFIAIFLFFLSVALIWTNRQDIALSLSMEHKLKAQSAARSGAYEAFARLREFGELGSYRGGILPGGAEVKVELVSLPPFGKRGDILLLRSRGQSGPVSSYLTLHLLDSRLSGEKNRDDKRVFFFPGGGAAAAAEEGGEPSEASSSGKALYGDFILQEGGPGVVEGMTANQGPAFFKRDLPPATYPPSFQDFLPVYSEDQQRLSAWGRVFVVAPPYPQVDGGKPTELQYLTYNGTDFEIVSIDPPVELGDPEPEPSEMQGAFIMDAPASGTWTTASVFGVGPNNVKTHVWTAEKPPTTNAGDIPEGEPFIGAPQQAGVLSDWSTISRLKPQQKFATRGEIWPIQSSVYSHAWHYLYQQHRGNVPTPITALDGATFTRWPCILKYTIGGSWEKAWTPLEEDGSVKTEHRPDPSVLLVSEDGKIFSVTEARPNEPRKLLTLSGKHQTTVGDEVPPGRLFLYRNQPYLIPNKAAKPGFLNLLRGDVIDFSTLPEFLPELYGEVVDVSGTEAIVTGIEGGYSGEPIDSSKRLSYTARPRVNFQYSFSPGVQVAVDGDDLWAVLNVTVDVVEPSFEKAYEQAPYSENTYSFFARYDGERWHILPNGLRTLLQNPSLSPPGSNVVAAIYPELPSQVNRYSIVSIDTNPFGFKP